jgi:prepilin-type N-terminal cleavage/methylation domain-containing protein
MLNPSAGSMTRQRGFSLVEMMVALVAGLIVVGSVLAFTVAMAKSTSQNIGAMRLEQEVRTASSLITREIRRAGYFRQNYNQIASNSFTQAYLMANVYDSGGTLQNSGSSGSCIVLAYDRNISGNSATAPIATEYKAFRRRVVGGIGVLEANLADNPPSCTNTTSTNWITLTNPLTVNISALTLTPTDSKVVAGTNPTNTQPICVTTRQINVVITGTARADTSISRTTSENVLIRSEQVTNPATCS